MSTVSTFAIFGIRMGAASARPASSWIAAVEVPRLPGGSAHLSGPADHRLGLHRDGSLHTWPCADAELTHPTRLPGSAATRSAGDTRECTEMCPQGHAACLEEPTVGAMERLPRWSRRLGTPPRYRAWPAPLAIGCGDGRSGRCLLRRLLCLAGWRERRDRERDAETPDDGSGPAQPLGAQTNNAP
jgi:hypothetical protein